MRVGRQVWWLGLVWVVVAGCAPGTGGGDEPDMAQGVGRDARVEGGGDRGVGDFGGGPGDGAVGDGAVGDGGGVDLGGDFGGMDLGQRDGSVADGSVPVLDESVPAPDESVRDESVPDESVPVLDASVPDESVPDESVPEPPDQGVPPPLGCGVRNAFPGLVAAGAGRRLRVDAFPSGHVQRRGVSVYLPVGYGRDARARYPVMYMHDGQNLFEAGEAAFGVEWQVDETVDALTAAGVVAPMIVVGIDNTPGRVREYTPSVDPGRGEGGEGGAYGRFIVEELKPWVEHNFAVGCGPAFAGLGGSSLGGLISLYIAEQHPDRFGRVAALSPSLWWNGREALSWVGSLAAGWDAGDRLWVDAGNGEGEDPDGDGLRSVVADVEALVAGLLAEGVVFGAELGLQVEAGAAHNEAAWAGRLPDVLTFLWGPAAGRAVALAGRPLRWPLSPGERAPVRVDAEWAGPLTMTVPPGEVALRSLTPAVAVVEGSGVRAVAVGQARVEVVAVGVEGEVEFLVVAPGQTTIEVTVPADTPAGSVVYVAGSDPAIGGWAPDGFALTPAGGRRWTGVLAMPLGTRFEFKITRGSWETVEKGPNGEELPNRVAVAAGAVIAVEVAGWRDLFE